MSISDPEHRSPKPELTVAELPSALRVTERERAEKLEHLQQMSEPALNQHLINRHLAMPGALVTIGLRFDAELAQYLGHSLDETALTMISLIKFIEMGKFGRTTTYTRMVLEPANQCWLENIELTTPKSVLDYITAAYSYTGMLHAELATLLDAGVVSDMVSPEIRPYADKAELKPLVSDSFFDQFSIVAQH